MDIIALHPSGLMGPSAGTHRSKISTMVLVKCFLQGAMPVIPDVKIGVVDVRDAATAHI